MGSLSRWLQAHTQILHMNTLVHIHSLENGPSKAQALKLTVMQKGGGGDWLGVGL